MDEQSQNAHDELTDQDQFRMSHHMYHLPPRKRRLYKRSAASSRRRGLPPTEYWQRQRISMRRGYYSTFCRIWQGVGSAPKGGGILPSPLPPPLGEVPPQGADEGGSRGCGVLPEVPLICHGFAVPPSPRVGKAEENPPVGHGLPRRCAPRNDGELGIDKRWEAGIMKVGGSPCLLTEVIVSWGTMGGYFFFIWIYLENQRNDADAQNAELNEIRIRDHLHHPLM